MKRLMVILGMLLIFANLISADEKTKKTIKPAHKGTVLVLGQEDGFLEYVHDEKKGEMTIYVSDKEGKSLKITEVPKLILFLNNNGAMSKKNVSATFLEENIKEADVFIAKDEALKTKELNGRISVMLGASSFQVNFKYDTPEEKEKREKEVKKEEEEIKKKEAEKK